MTTGQAGLTEHTGSIHEFTARIGVREVGGDNIMDAQAAHLATIGADWYVFYGARMAGYIIARQGHAGGDGLGLSRGTRPLTWWSTDPALSQFAAWTTAVEFITAQVYGDLKNEWGE
jgi:hypothetical protein